MACVGADERDTVVQCVDLVFESILKQMQGLPVLGWKHIEPLAKWGLARLCARSLLHGPVLCPTVVNALNQNCVLTIFSNYTSDTESGTCNRI
jgi:hypothetical protein